MLNVDLIEKGEDEEQIWVLFTLFYVFSFLFLINNDVYNHLYTWKENK